MEYKHNKGKIGDSAIKALVTDCLFKQRTEIPKKGKGSYSRKNKYYKKELLSSF